MEKDQESSDKLLEFFVHSLIVFTLSLNALFFLHKTLLSYFL